MPTLIGSPSSELAVLLALYFLGCQLAACWHLPIPGGVVGRMGKLTLLLLAILVWLQYSLWFGKNGIHDYTRVNDDVAAQQATNAKLKARNDQLFAEIDDLNGGQEALEERARNELSMTRPGETFYRLVPDASKRAQSAGQNNR